MELPSRVKKRMYVVHTSALPPDCELRVAPTGTAGTIRLDQLQKSRGRGLADRGMSHRNWGGAEKNSTLSIEEDSNETPSAVGADREYDSSSLSSFDEAISSQANTLQTADSSFANLGTSSVSSNKKSRANSMFSSDSIVASIPLVSLRPASSTDAWFILNLLSAVPFLSSLSYSSTMEVLETCRVDAYCVNDVVVPVSRRKQVLCVVWEGTCAERPKSSTSSSQARGSYALPPIGGRYLVCRRLDRTNSIAARKKTKWRKWTQRLS